MEEEDQEPSLEELRGLLYEWRNLIAQPGFARFKQYIKDQVFRRRRELDNPACEHPTFMRGECAFGELMQHIADLELARLEEEVQEQLKQEEEKRGEDQDYEADLFEDGPGASAP